MSRVRVTSGAQASGAVFVSHDRGSAAIVGDASRLDHVADVDAHEGPVWVPREGALYFTSLPRPGSDGAPAVAIRRLAIGFPVGAGPEPGDVEMVVGSANAANGMTLDPDGRHLLVCEQGTPSTDARIARLDPATGASDTVVDRWEGLRLNSPNDVAVRHDGSIWFTDPSYGHLQGFRPEPEVGDFVYRFDPATGSLSVVDDGFDKPNGLAFSPDGSVLYVTDSGANQEPGSYHVERPHHVVAFDVRDGHLTGRRLLAVVAPGFPDGIKTDELGNVYVSSFSGVQVFTPDGDRLGEIRLPGAVNFDFGGPDGDVLFVTIDDAVWAVRLSVRGARFAPPHDGRSVM